MVSLGIFLIKCNRTEEAGEDRSSKAKASSSGDAQGEDKEV